MKQNSLTIYIDLDDVVADWMATAKKILQHDWVQGERIPEDEWEKLKKDQRFYRSLPKKAGADELVEWCRNYKITTGCELFFLTALPHDYSVPYAAQDKVWWAHERFPDIPVFFGPFSTDKWRHCKPNDILIDDRRSNIEEWINAGGRGHIYKSWEQCKEWLEKTLDNDSKNR